MIMDKIEQESFDKYTGIVIDTMYESANDDEIIVCDVLEDDEMNDGILDIPSFVGNDVIFVKEPVKVPLMTVFNEIELTKTFVSLAVSYRQIYEAYFKTGTDPEQAAYSILDVMRNNSDDIRNMNNLYLEGMSLAYYYIKK
jgi:hypothetical protein